MIDLLKLPLPASIITHIAALPRHRLADLAPDNPMAKTAYAGLALGKHGYMFGFGEHLADRSLEEQAIIILHEYAHLAYGHIPYAVASSLDPVLWNIACDAWINEAHDKGTIQALHMVEYTQLQKMCPTLPSILVSPRYIYECLLQAGRDQLAGMGKDVLILSDGTAPNFGEAALQQLTARAAIREAIESGKCSDALKRALDMLRGASITGNRLSVSPVGAPIPCPWLAAILAHLRGISRWADLVRTRGWYRPGRTELTAGSRRRPGPLVLLAIDVSGSTSEFWGSFIATGHALAARYRLHVALYSDAVIWHGRSVPAYPQVSGGTQFGPVWRMADVLRAHLVINVTDGDNADAGASLPTTPVIWLYTPSHRAHSLRPCDKQFVMVKGNE